MQLNQPYDPRYNAKLYIPKLTEEERRARATPLENLRGLRFRSEVPAAPLDVPAPAEAVIEAPAPQDNTKPQGTPVPLPDPESRSVAIPEKGPASPSIPTALEVLCAEFPEIFAPQASRPHKEALADDECLASAGPVCNDAGLDRPRHSKAYDRSHYTALLACESGTRSFPVPLHMDVGNEPPLVPKLCSCHFP